MPVAGIDNIPTPVVVRAYVVSFHALIVAPQSWDCQHSSQVIGFLCLMVDNRHNSGMMVHMKQQLTTIAGVAIGALSLFGAANMALAKTTAYECETAIVTVHPGDTAWGIASRYCDGHTGAATDAIVQAHGTASLQVGDRITLP